MSDWKKSVLPAVVIVGAIAAFVVGNDARARLDTGRAVNSAPCAEDDGPETLPRELAPQVRVF